MVSRLEKLQNRNYIDPLLTMANGLKFTRRHVKVDDKLRLVAECWICKIELTKGGPWYMRRHREHCKEKNETQMRSQQIEPLVESNYKFCNQNKDQGLSDDSKDHPLFDMSCVKTEFDLDSNEYDVANKLNPKFSEMIAKSLSESHSLEKTGKKKKTQNLKGKCHKKSKVAVENFEKFGFTQKTIQTADGHNEQIAECMQCEFQLKRPRPYYMQRHKNGCKPNKKRRATMKIRREEAQNKMFISNDLEGTDENFGGSVDWSSLSEKNIDIKSEFQQSTDLCFLCYLGTNEGLHSTDAIISKYSNTSIIEFLLKFSHGDESLQSIVTKTTNLICSMCLEKIDEYDLACTTASRIENEMYEMMRQVELKRSHDMELMQSLEPAVFIETPPKSNPINESEHSEPEDKDRYENVDHHLLDDDSSADTEVQPKSNDDDHNELDNSSDFDWTVNAEQGPAKTTQPTSRDKCFCEICYLDFKNTKYEENFSEHEQVHTNIAALQCFICSQKYNNKYILKTHILRHLRNEQEPKHQCHECGKMYYDKFTLQNHVKHFHQNIRPYECVFCHAKIHMMCDLRKHMRIHVPSKVHMCSLCGRKFARRYDMKRHEERHDKEKKFVCQVCGEAFDRKYKLFEHRKANHIKRRPRKQKPKAAEDSGKITKLKLHTN